MTRLIHLNGVPGVGKTSLASRYVDDHPLTLLIDIDATRTALGQWNAYDESKVLARDLALAMAETHLGNGHDVIVPQYVGRREFIVALRDVAQRSGAGFVEVLLDADHPVAVERFRSRRSRLATHQGSHPEADVLDSDVESTVSDAFDNLTRAMSDMPVVRIDVNHGLDQSYIDLVAAIDQRLD